MKVDTYLKTDDNEWARYLASFLEEKLSHQYEAYKDDLYYWIVEWQTSLP